MASKQILIVDDDEQIRELLRDFIGGLGYEVATANDGKDALEKFLSDKFDMVISDLMMPDMGGLELIKQIRER